MIISLLFKKFVHSLNTNIQCQTILMRITAFILEKHSFSKVLIFIQVNKTKTID